MKKIIITLVFSIVSFLLNAQSVFDKFGRQDGVTAMVINKKMFQMMSNVKVDSQDKDTQQYLALIKKLDNLRVYTTSNPEIAADIVATATSYSKTGGFEEFSAVTDNGKYLKIWTKSDTNKSQVKELVMLSEKKNEDKETVLMTLTGSFDLNEINILTDKMKISGADALKKATKAK